jgi:PAS domain S-box-containing protein
MANRQANTPNQAPPSAACERDSLFVNHPLPMLIYDARTGAILEVNQAACALCGYSHAELLTISLPNLHLPAERPQVLGILERDAAAYNGEWRHQRRDGSLIEVITTTSPAPLAQDCARRGLISSW